MLDNPCKDDCSDGVSLPVLLDGILHASCACGETVTLHAVNMSESPPCTCGRTAAEAIVYGPHRHQLAIAAMDARRQNTEETNVVYFARRGNVVKIGTTGNLRKRLASHGWPEFLGCIDGGYPTEREMHVRFAAHRIGTGKSEWFEAHDDILSFVVEHGYRPDLSPPSPTEHWSMPYWLRGL